MAKRKAAPRRRSGPAKAKGRKRAGRSTAARKSRASAKKAPARRKAAKAAAKRGRVTARKAPRRSSRRAAPKKKAVARKAPARKAAPRRSPGQVAKKAAPKAAPKKATAKKAAPPRSPGRAPKTLAVRKAPALDRARRTVQDEDLVPGPPSSLDLDRTASAVRSGRKGLSDKFREHTETSPAVTGGDVDADWESAYAVGDEAPGGDNPTPDQDIVDDIGKALGVQYEDNEELKGEKKISDRDKKRWELDPASAEDYPDHEED